MCIVSRPSRVRKRGFVILFTILTTRSRSPRFAQETTSPIPCSGPPESAQSALIRVPFFTSHWYSQDLHRGVAAVDGDDAAAGVGGGAAEEDARHRGAVVEASVPHIGRQAFALEDMAAGQAD